MWIAIPIAVAATAAIGFAACKALGFDPHFKEMSLAGAACLIAGELALIPLSRTRVPTQANVAQAGLLGSVIHLFGSAGIGGAMLMAKSLNSNASLMYWLLAFYWATLIVIAMGFVKAIKAAPVTMPNQSQP